MKGKETMGTMKDRLTIQAFAAAQAQFAPAAKIDRKMLAEAAQRQYEESSPARKQIAKYERRLSPAQRARMIAEASAQAGTVLPPIPPLPLLPHGSHFDSTRQFVTDDMDTLRKIAVRFFSLPLSRRSAIANKLNLVAREDSTQRDFERSLRAFLRARERGVVADLDREVREVEA